MNAREFCGRCGTEIELTERGWRHYYQDSTHAPVLGVPAPPDAVRQPPEPEPIQAPFPEPEVRARPATRAEMPKTCSSLVNLAESNGWVWVCHYARGTQPSNDGTPAEVTTRVPLLNQETGLPERTEKGRERYSVTGTGELIVVDSIVARFAKPMRRIVAVWNDGKFVNGYQWAGEGWSAIASAAIRSALKGER